MPKSERLSPRVPPPVDPSSPLVSTFQRPSWMQGVCPDFGWVTVTGVLKLLPRTLFARPLSFGVHRDCLTFGVSQVKWNIKKKKCWFYFTWHFYMLCREAVSDHFVSILSGTEVKSYLGCWKNKGLHTVTRLAWCEIVKLWPERLGCISMSWKYVSLLGGVLQNLTYGVVFHPSMNWGSAFVLKTCCLGKNTCSFG